MHLLTTTQAAKVKGVTSARIRQLLLAGRLKATKYGRDWMIDPKELAACKPLPQGRKKLEATP